MTKCKKNLSVLLAVCLLISVLPTASLAAAVDTTALHNCNVPEGYHLFTDLPTAEDPVTTETLYWGNAFNGVLHGMNSSFTTSSSDSTATTTTDVAKMNTITIHYGGNDATYGDYYYLVFTLASGTSYAVAYGSGYYTQNTIQSTGLPSGGWAAKHKFFYNAEEHLFFHRPSSSMTTMKAPVVSASSYKFFTNKTLDKVLANGAYPVRMYEPCTSDGVKGTTDTHQWSGSCSCGYKFDYQEKESEVVEVEIIDPAGYHRFDIAGLPTQAGESVSNLYLGAAFEANGTFYGMSSTASNNAYPTATTLAEQCKITIRYGGEDDTYGTYYYVEFTLPSGVTYALAYAGGYFTQNRIQADGLPSGGWAAKHKMFFEEDYQLFYHRPSADMTVMKGLKISAESKKLFVETVENLQVVSADYSPVRLFEACTSDNVAGQNTTHHWSGACRCGEKFDYEPNYVMQTRAPQANTPYFWGVTQLDAEGDPTYFFAGEDLGSTFNTQADMLTATSVYVDVVDGGYKLYFLKEGVKQYICLGKDAANSYKTYIDFTENAANATVYTWNATYNTFVTPVVKDAAGNTVDMVLGAYTSGSTAYTKISALLLTHLAQEHYFASKLYVEHMTHTYDAWGYDEQNHWKECFCGRKQEKATHTLGDLVVEDGKVVRKCDCGYIEQAGTVPAVDGYSISLKDNFAINFFVKKAHFDGDTYKDPYMVFVMKGQQTEVTAYTTRDDYYVFTFDNLAPDLMKETVTAKLYATIGEEVALVDTGAYSVGQYCYTALRNEGSGDALRTLLVETLNFGAACQKFRDSSVAAEDLVNADLTDAERALGYTGALRALNSCRDFGDNNGNMDVRWYGATLVMGESIKLRMYFTTDDITDLSIKIVGQTIGEYTLTDIGSKDGRYYVDFAELSPGQMDEKLSFTVYKGEDALSATMTYSMESYAHAWMNHTNVSQTQKDLVEAVIRYGDAAKDYAQRAYELQEDVCYIGRTYELNGTQWFNWSASGFSVRFQGSGLTAKIASNAPNATNYAYLKVYVDGVEQTDILLDKTMQTVILAEGLNDDEIHTVEVRKRNSPRSSTAGLVSMEVQNGVKLDAPAAKDKLIEFVGDSLTVGYSAAITNPAAVTAWSTATEDGTKTYSKQVADAFGAEYMVTAISGRGVVMNNANAEGPKLPDIYPELDIYNVPGTAYDFALQPDVIVINLGTNDATNSGLNMDVFQAGVVNFIRLVRQNNPHAQIIWVYGLRQDTKTAEVAVAIEAAVAQVRESDTNVHYLPLDLVPSAQTDLNHPLAEGYTASSEKLIEKITEITGW